MRSHLWGCKLVNHSTPVRLPLHAATEEFILSKVDFLLDSAVWFHSDSLDPHGWLQNFETHERPFALNLLNVFLYYNEQLVDALFRRAVLQLSRAVTRTARTTIEADEQWMKFIGEILVTYVEGENPNPSDSGYVFARKARQVLGIEEDQIVSPGDVLSAYLRTSGRTVLLVDDFVGSGSQTLNTWHHRYDIGNGDICSLARASENGARIIYVPIVSTSQGMETVNRTCPGLQMCPSHILERHYSLTDPDSILWPADLKPHAVDFLRTASDRAGITPHSEIPWDGYQGLGLGVAFSHCVPDATIPLYYWEQFGWTPLIRRA